MVRSSSDRIDWLACEGVSSNFNRKICDLIVRLLHNHNVWFNQFTWLKAVRSTNTRLLVFEDPDSCLGITKATRKDVIKIGYTLSTKKSGTHIAEEFFRSNISKKWSSNLLNLNILELSRVVAFLQIILLRNPDLRSLYYKFRSTNIFWILPLV